jgi:hypothetical protein
MNRVEFLLKEFQIFQREGTRPLVVLGDIVQHLYSLLISTTVQQKLWRFRPM